MAALRFRADGLFGQDGAAAGDVLHQFLVLGRVADIDPAGDDGDRARLERAGMGGGVDAARQAGRDSDPGLAKPLCDRARDTLAVRRSIARADDRDDRRIAQRRRAGERNQRRRILRRRQAPGIVGLLRRNQPGAGLPGCDDLGLRRSDRSDADRLRPSAAAGQFGQRLERVRDRAEMAQKVPEGHGADILAPDQPEPVGPFPVRQRLPVTVFHGVSRSRLSVRSMFQKTGA